MKVLLDKWAAVASAGEEMEVLGYFKLLALDIICDAVMGTK